MNTEFKYTVITEFWDSGVKDDWCWITIGQRYLPDEPAGKWYSDPIKQGMQTWYFKNEDDAILFKLRWL